VRLSELGLFLDRGEMLGQRSAKVAALFHLRGASESRRGIDA
jgi:hypothetical protein